MKRVKLDTVFSFSSRPSWEEEASSACAAAFAAGAPLCAEAVAQFEYQVRKPFSRCLPLLSVGASL